MPSASPTRSLSSDSCQRRAAERSWPQSATAGVGRRPGLDTAMPTRVPFRCHQHGSGSFSDSSPALQNHFSPSNPRKKGVRRTLPPRSRHCPQRTRSRGHATRTSSSQRTAGKPQAVAPPGSGGDVPRRPTLHPRGASPSSPLPSAPPRTTAPAEGPPAAPDTPRARGFAHPEENSLGNCGQPPLPPLANRTS